MTLTEDIRAKTVSKQVLIAGIGNIFLGDDAFGVEVVQQLQREQLPDRVRVVDFGIRGLDFAYALLDGYDAVILVDAAPRGGEPGTLYVFEPDIDEPSDYISSDGMIETHGMVPEKVLRWLISTGAQVPSVRIVGCEPSSVLPATDPQIGLSPPVAAAVEQAVEKVKTIAAEMLAEAHVAAT